MIAQHTDVPTPRIHDVDLTRSIVPTGYMVMDYMVGNLYGFLTHPNNPMTSPVERVEIFRGAGTATSQIHGITRTASTPDAGKAHVLT
ncbi:MAG: hypothetical protein QF878_08600, partial [SAR202 cluster bacterium]|nr:hypothetical protein [SAR202 cluster bacterium]